jgi:hypothetical protein
MGQAFEAARKELDELGSFQRCAKSLHNELLQRAHMGELDPVRLRMAALSWIISRTARSLALSDYNPQAAKPGLSTRRVILDPIDNRSRQTVSPAMCAV